MFFTEGDHGWIGLPDFFRRIMKNHEWPWGDVLRNGKRKAVLSVFFDRNYKNVIDDCYHLLLNNKPAGEHI